MPKVTVLMPLYNGKKFIKESLESIQNQTFADWEFLIVNDFGSNDGCADIVRQYAEKDPRIVLIQTEERLGIAGSLNVGLDRALGEYVARVDVDDPSEPDRLEKQVMYMDEHPEVSLCSCWQRSVTPQRSYVQEAACDPDELKAAMIFGCEISHCGVMLRKKDFDEHSWRYDPAYLGEDYELWTRLQLEGAKLVNIPDVLVSHRWGFGNISIAKGDRLKEEISSISARILNEIGVDTSSYPLELLRGWRSKPEQYAKKDPAAFMREGYRLFQELLKKNEEIHYCSQDALRKTLFCRWNWICESCGIRHTEFSFGQFRQVSAAPTVSVVLPTFCSVEDISQALDCVQAQTYTDWELLVINDYGSDDGTAEMVKVYSWGDPRIHLIQAEQRLGLAESLNLGIREAQGKYVARLDADDTSKPERFAKQIEYLEKHPEIGILGTWQHHYGKGSDWVHKAAPSPEVQRCRLLFWCDLCHSTLMLRKSVFLDNQLFYDPSAIAEDYELWTRAMEYTQIANLPEVLGEYREGTGITNPKIQQLAEESGRITAKTLKRILGISVPFYKTRLLNAWINPMTSSLQRDIDLQELQQLFVQIWHQNAIVKFFDSQELLQVLAAKWFWTKDGVDWKYAGYRHFKQIEDVFNDKYRPSLFTRYKMFKQNNPKLPVRVKKITTRYILRRPVMFVRKITRGLMQNYTEDISRTVERWTWDRFKRTDRSIEKWTWDRYKWTEKLMHSYNFEIQYVPYYRENKIRVVFLFQVASFWPAQESIYQTLSADLRFDVKLICYNEPIDSSIKTESAQQYLEERGYDFIYWKQFSLEDFNPHIVFLQTAYDTNRRQEFKSGNLCQQGIRVIYIPYGIEIADTAHAHKDHFRRDVVQNTWKIYTLSELMRQDYLRYLRHKKDVCVLGLPRFDALYHRENFLQLEEVKQEAKGRKVILWKVHFPKVIRENEETILVTPYIQEYIKFAEKLNHYGNLFFVFMPHPRFKEFNDDVDVKQQLNSLYDLLEQAENVYIDDSDDYRNSLLNADCIIVDRSAVMVEAGSVGVPVLYMFNPDYKEPMTKAVEPLIDSYYQGTTCEDIENFLHMFLEGKDPKRDVREKAFQICIPHFDGMCGERIKEDIIQSLEQELGQNLQEQLIAQNAWIEEQSTKLKHYISGLKRDLAEEIDKSVEHWTWDRYRRVQFLKLIPRGRLQRLTVHLAEHCNLNCQCCDNFSPLAREEYANIMELEKDFSRLRELSDGDIGIIELSGGEAILHPKICDFLDLTRKYFEKIDIQILTNGILLPTMPDVFWESCHKNKVCIVITKYPIQLNMELIEEKARYYDVSWRYYSNEEVKTTNFNPQDLSGRQDGRMNFIDCYHANECIYLRNGRIYTCSISANIKHFNKAFEENLPDTSENSISIYEAKSMREILDFLSRPIPLCDYCNVRDRKRGLTWGISKKEKSEWVNMK